MKLANRRPNTSPSSAKLNQALDAKHWQDVEEATELLLQNEPRQALLLLKSVVIKDPANPYAYYYIGTAMFEVGRFDAAIDAYRAAVRLSPAYLAARLGLSHSLRIEGEPLEAVKQARLALKHHPGDGDSLFALGLALASSGDRHGAITALEAFLRTKPEFEIFVEATAMLNKLKDLDDDTGPNP